MSDRRADEGEPAGRLPRWVKVSLIVALLVAVLVVVMMLVGGGGHGPGRHSGAATIAGVSPWIW